MWSSDGRCSAAVVRDAFVSISVMASLRFDLLQIAVEPLGPEDLSSSLPAAPLGTVLTRKALLEARGFKVRASGAAWSAGDFKLSS
jgi:hypothetical protein